MNLRVFVIPVLFTFLYLPATAQKVDSIFFHLYTDSLKKGVYNYINVDGKLSNGQWRPLTDKEIRFTCSAGQFEGNSLLIDTASREEQITVTAVLKSDTSIRKVTSIYIKKAASAERLKTMEEVMKGTAPPKRRRKNS